ncbi:dihydrodipicolinate synthase family protein [Spelaeicoccus albus]|uniref:Dihydrodipicolinate synthase/N-acetylneuraminate lyase n=1 Tax=Spelaeicoccus albus TaxID=1280376 RepID=A0A7Z0D1T9_9MICO|nr:dihydrodipicolinate synthase family protein [Spelaeicoccus albus]NYI66820.1 dihydrodipicolinate synthase/N-acetylneuraminate lyase [Spelaeicoccus albus]
MAVPPVIITAVPTAFTRTGELNIDGTREIFRKSATSGVDGAFVLGTTGEFPSLSFDERGRVAEVAVEELAGKRCIIHVGAASAFEVLRLIDQAREAGATEIAAITPYYLSATDAALLAYYTAISEASDGLRVYVYAFRARTGNFVSPELMGKLAALPNIVGAKVSGESLDQIAAYRAAVPDEFIIYTGSDRDVVHAVERGAQGIVSGVGSALPGPFLEAASRIAAGASRAELDAAQAAVNDAVDVIGGNFASIKTALTLQGIDAGYVRMAIDEPDDAKLADIKRTVQRFGALAG